MWESSIGEVHLFIDKKYSYMPKISGHVCKLKNYTTFTEE